MRPSDFTKHWKLNNSTPNFKNHQQQLQQQQLQQQLQQKQQQQRQQQLRQQRNERKREANRLKNVLKKCSYTCAKCGWTVLKNDHDQIACMSKCELNEK